MGDPLVRLNGETGLTVRQVRGSPRKETVYNFEVKEFHTYFVGQQGVWVHNDCEREVLEELVDEDGIDLLFGQKRISRNFRENSDAPASIKGRTIDEVAKDIVDPQAELSVEDFVLQAFRHEGRLVTINNRGLAALSLADKKPVFVQVVKPTKAGLRRLKEEPLRPDLPLPGPRIPITSGKNSVEIDEIVSISGN